MSKQLMDMSEASWLMMETRERPVHVATLLIYQLPENAPSTFLADLVSDLRQETEFASPFNKRLAYPSFRQVAPVWQEDYDPDMEYHVRHLALPAPGGERELGVLISRLHSQPMDFNRPLWEYHIIEGLENNRFAIYYKMHHSLVDGIAGVRMLQRSMSTDPEAMDTPALWSAGAGSATRPAFADHLRNMTGTFRNAIPIGKRLLEVARSALDSDDPLVRPFQTPVSILNRRIHSQRRFATQLYELDRIKRIAKGAECTLNDVVLALCAGALRKFLMELCALPGKPLTAGIPVSLRAKDDQGAGTAVSFIVATLATNVADPVRRLKAIKESTARAKKLLSGMSKEGIEAFTNTLLSPSALQSMMGMEGRTRPVFNLTISNVPGPAETLYFRGARLEAMYPVSAVTHGQALNITCYSYDGAMSFGFAGCRDTLPRMQRIAVYTGEALEELEHALFGKNGSNGMSAKASSGSEKPNPRPRARTSRKAGSES